MAFICKLSQKNPPASQKIFNWRKIVSEDKNKEVGADPEIIYDMLNSFSLKYPNTIKLISQPDTNTFKHKIQTITDDILYAGNNSSAPRSAKRLC